MHLTLVTPRCSVQIPRTILEFEEWFGKRKCATSISGACAGRRDSFALGAKVKTPGRCAGGWLSAVPCCRKP
jgi:hypothetical protein